MKKSMVLTAALVVCASVVVAAQNKAAPAKKKPLVEEVSGQGYGTAGCGLGSILFGEKPGMIQVLAATTNNVYSNQTFGMSSGTSNCRPEGDAEAAATAFIDANRVALETDISRGNGENIAAYSKIIGCGDSTEIGAQLQRNYSSIFGTSTKSSSELKDSIREAIKKDGALAQSCTHLG